MFLQNSVVVHESVCGGQALLSSERFIDSFRRLLNMETAMNNVDVSPDIVKILNLLHNYH